MQKIDLACKLNTAKYSNLPDRYREEKAESNGVTRKLVQESQKGKWRKMVLCPLQCALYGRAFSTDDWKACPYRERHVCQESSTTEEQ